VTSAASGDDLPGSGWASRVDGDATAAQVLVKGEALSPQRGRADDFAWPPGSELKVEPVAAPAPVKKSETPAAPAVAAVAPAAPAAQAAKPSPSIAAPEPEAGRSQAAVEPGKPKPAPKTTREAEAERRNAPPRPPRSVQRQNGNDRGGLFGLFR